MTTLDLQNLPLAKARIVFPPLWVVYFPAADAGNGYAVRCWYGMTPEPWRYPFATLAECRAHIRDAGGCYRMDPQQGDEPHVLETWL